MKKLLIAMLVLSVSGCSTIADFYNKQDRCQTKSRAADEPAPSWCGMASGNTYNVSTPLYRNQYLIYRN